MKKVLNYIFLALLTILLSRCQEQDEKLAYTSTRTEDVSDITAEGATFNGTVIAGTKFSVVNRGFVWGENPRLDLNNSEIVNLGAGPVGKFSARISTSLAPGKEYYVRSFVVSKNGNEDHTYYAEYVTFISLGSEAPKVFDFYPHLIGIGDTVTIKGKNFSVNPFKNVVTFGRIPAAPYFSNDSIIYVIVPDSLAETKVPVSVSLTGNKGSSSAVYDVKPPEITDFYPDYGYNGSYITVYGKNFIKNNTILKSGKGSFTINFISGQYMQAVVNSGSGIHPLVVEVFGKTDTSKNNFTNYAVAIDNITPLQGTFNDIITITGDNLNTYCQIGNSYCEVVSSSSTELKVKVPPELNVSTANILVYSWGGWISYDKTFKLNSITADSFSPSNGGIGSSVTVKGDNFSTSTYNSSVYFGDVRANTISATKNEIVVQVPANASTSSTLSVKVADQSGVLIGTFSISPATITDFQPRKGTTGTEITITGTNFSPDVNSYGEIKIGQTYCTISSATETQLVVRLLESTDTYLSPLVVNLGSQQLSLAETFECVWIKKNNVPTSSVGLVSFTYDNKGYIFSGYNNWNNQYPNELWQYDPTNDSWQQKSKPAITGRSYASSFVIGSNLYVGLGYNNIYYNNFWKYDIINDTWTAIANFPGESRLNPISFSINGKGYLGTGTGYSYYEDFWEYDPTSNQWNTIPAFPGGIRYGGISFEANGEIIAGLGALYDYKNDLWKFNPSDKTWTRLNDFPGNGVLYTTTFKIGEKVYLTNGSGPNGLLNEVWEYDYTNDTWTQKMNFAGSGRSSSVGFSINGKAYVGLGDTWGNLSNDLWQYNADLDN